MISSRSSTVNSARFASLPSTAMTRRSYSGTQRSIRSRWPLWMGSKDPGYTAMRSLIAPLPVAAEVVGDDIVGGVGDPQRQERGVGRLAGIDQQRLGERVEQAVGGVRRLPGAGVDAVDRLADRAGGVAHRDPQPP